MTDRKCEVCDSPMIDIGEWPDFQDRSKLLHRWHCTLCDKYVSEPVQNPPQHVVEES